MNHFRVVDIMLLIVACNSMDFIVQGILPHHDKVWQCYRVVTLYYHAVWFYNNTFNRFRATVQVGPAQSNWSQMQTRNLSCSDHQRLDRGEPHYIGSLSSLSPDLSCIMDSLISASWLITCPRHTFPNSWIPISISRSQPALAPDIWYSDSPCFYKKSWHHSSARRQDNLKHLLITMWPGEKSWLWSGRCRGLALTWFVSIRSRRGGCEALIMLRQGPDAGSAGAQDRPGVNWGILTIP